MFFLCFQAPTTNHTHSMAVKAEAGLLFNNHINHENKAWHVWATADDIRKGKMCVSNHVIQVWLEFGVEEAAVPNYKENSETIGTSMVKEKWSEIKKTKASKKLFSGLWSFLQLSFPLSVPATSGLSTLLLRDSLLFLHICIHSSPASSWALPLSSFFFLFFIVLSMSCFVVCNKLSPPSHHRFPVGPALNGHLTPEADRQGGRKRGARPLPHHGRHRKARDDGSSGLLEGWTQQLDATNPGGNAVYVSTLSSLVC